MTEEKGGEGPSVARTISMTKQEWIDLQKIANRWKTSRSGALRRIWLEWEQGKSQAAGAGQAGQDGAA